MDFSELKECWFAEEVGFGGCVSALVVVVEGRKSVTSGFAAIFLSLEELLVWVTADSVRPSEVEEEVESPLAVSWAQRGHAVLD